MTTDSTPTTSTPEDKKHQHPLRRIVWWALLLDLIASLVLTIVDIVAFDALTRVAHYHGVGKIVGAIAFSLAAFFSSLFVVTVWMVLVVFIIAFVVFVFFIMPKWIKNMHQPPQATTEATTAAEPDTQEA